MHTRSFNNRAAQGDIYFWKISELPKNAEIVPPENGVNIVTHSETGHHHVMDAGTTTMYRLPDSIMDCLLVVTSETELRHLRSYDTHKPIAFTPGIYQVRRQREYTPEGFRRVED